MVTEEEQQTIKAKLLLRRLSPFVFIFLLSISLIIFGYYRSNETDGWSLMVIPIFGILGFFSILLDYLLKKMIPQGALKIWLIELGIILIGSAWYNWG